MRVLTLLGRCRAAWWPALAALAGCGGESAAKNQTVAGGGQCSTCAAGGQSGSGGTGIAGDSGDSGSTADFTLSEVSLWQTQRVPLLLAGGTQPARQVPIIRAKEGILRAYLATDADFVPRDLSATLSVRVGGVTSTLANTKHVVGSSSDADLSSTFDFSLDANQIALDTALALEIGEPGGAVPLARFPAQGLAPINGHGIGTKEATMTIVIVPIVIAGITPDVSLQTVQTFHDRVRSMYPVSTLEISVRAQVSSDITIGPDAGWEQLLDFLYALRAQDAPPANSYYFGLFTPAPTFDAYCTSSCTVGISQVADLGEIGYRGAIGLDIFPDGSGADAPDTMAHELGHALGREHAPCDVTDPDPSFPYPDGSIGVWGYDATQHQLLDPQRTSDVMSYCEPDWTSDYTFLGMYQRLAEVAAQPAQPAQRRAAAGDTPYRRVIVTSRGELALGSVMSFAGTPRGRAEAVSLHDARGAKLREEQGYYQPLPDGRGQSGFLLVPESALSASGTSALRRGDRELKLR